MKPTFISCHADNDDARFFRFERNTRLPLGTFPRGHRINPETVVMVVCLVGAAFVIIATGVL